MPIGYIIRQAGIKTGLNPDLEADRVVLLRFLNEAAAELYDQSDLDGMLMEQVFKVDGDQQIALPPDIGPLRAMREYSTHVPWHLYDMRPRYNQSNWQDRWRSWRLKGTSPISGPINNQSKVTVRVRSLETPALKVTITGPTDVASSISETVVMDNLSTAQTLSFIKQTVTNFTNITAIKKDRVNGVDVEILDLDGELLSRIPNNMLQMRYRLIDVSLYPWSNIDVNPQGHWMEILFKPALPWFQNDDDEFPAVGYDNIIVNKMLQLYYEEQGDSQKALLYDTKATRSSARKKEDATRGIEEQAALVEHPHDNLLPRNRPLGPSRYQGQIYY